MEIILAKSAGFCGGVRNIAKITETSLDKLDRVYAHGQLIHNSQYVDYVKNKGLGQLDSLDQVENLNEKSNIIGRAHGLERETKERIIKLGHNYIDGTCPVLLEIYKKISYYDQMGYKIVIVGDPCHPEVMALNSQVDGRALIVSTKEEAKKVQKLHNIYIISQTTNIYEKFFEISDIIKDENVNVKVDNTICNTTKVRQQECLELSKKVDVMIVIGGRNSSNTDKLYQIARNNCKKAYKIETIDQLPLQSIKKYNTIGITAGASTPSWIIEEVVNRMDNFNSEEFMEQVKDSMIRIYPKDIVKGTVINVKDNEIFVDIKYRADGIIKLDEMSEEESADPTKAFEEGEEIDVFVIKLDDGEGNVALSTRRVQGLKNWKNLMAAFENNEIVEAKVTGDNSGGLVVSVMGISGFIPASQITTYYVKNFKQFVGQTLDCRIISIDEKKKRVVLSSRVVKEEKLDDVWEKIIVGEKITGKVVRMTDFGAFVDLGGVDALIHVSDIAWERIDKPSDVLEIGQEVEALVLKANRERNRVSLGLKQLTEKPFDVFVKNNKVGDVVDGVVVNLLDFGAFVRLEEGVEGLVHVSQVSNVHVEKPSDELNLDDEVQVKILEIDEENQRISLSMRALMEPLETVKENKAVIQEIEKRENAAKDEDEDQVEYAEEKREEFDASNDIGINIGSLIESAVEKQDN